MFDFNKIVIRTIAYDGVSQAVNCDVTGLYFSSQYSCYKSSISMSYSRQMNCATVGDTSLELGW